MENQINKLAKKENVNIECYTSGTTSNVDDLRTENCNYVGDYIPDNMEAVDYRLMSPQNYNCTLNSNSSETETATILVVIVE